jgi:hypothetical protein
MTTRLRPIVHLRRYRIPLRGKAVRRRRLETESPSTLLKNQLFLIIPTVTPIFLPIGRLAFHSFPKTFSFEGINPILRC